MSLEALLVELRAVLGADLLCGEDIPLRATSDASVWPAQKPLALLRPATTDEVSAALRLCNDHGVAVTVQGGMTGLSGGATPTFGSVALSLERMAGIEHLDQEAGTVLVKAGTILSVVQDAATAVEMLYPVDLNARASCTIGGTVATNAGGNRVIRYGMTRAGVLGLEAVLADGTVLSDLRDLPKNNAGFDLKQLFIGTEGQIGVVTRVLLRLLPRPVDRGCALLAISDFPTLRKCLISMKRDMPEALSAFEAMWPDYWDIVTAGGLAGRRSPFSRRHGIYALVEAGGARDADAETLTRSLERLFEDGLIEDAVLAQSGSDIADFWALREAAAEVSNVVGPCVGYDIGLAPTRIGAYVDEARAALAERAAEATPMFFGHAGDGNLHVMIAGPDSTSPDFIKLCDGILYPLVGAFDGTVTAEHGVGQLKREWLWTSRSDEELSVMRRLKHALDPKGTLNPGKVLPRFG